MTRQQRDLILACLDTEIGAVARDLRERQPATDYWRRPITDIRQEHLDRLIAARRSLMELRL